MERKTTGFSKKLLSCFLSVCLVTAMIPFAVIPSIAETAEEQVTEFTAPVSSSGKWEHALDNVYNDGRGTHFVTMWVESTDFVFMQTKDNEKFTFAPTLYAVKNDGVNYAKIKKTTITNTTLNPTATLWEPRTDLNSKNTNPAPDGAALPGYLSQGFEKQMAQNVLSWDCNYYFDGEGAAQYETRLLIDYETGPYIMNTEDVNNYVTLYEPVIYTITVVDERELIKAVDAAKDYIASGNATQEQIDALQALVENAETGHMTDGTVAYTQEEIDAVTDAIHNHIPADYTNYLNALKAANAILNDSSYSDAEKEIISTEINTTYPSSQVLSTNMSNQAYVDEATKSLENLLATIGGTEVDAPNSVSVPIGTSKTWVYDCTAKTGWTNANINDSTIVNISHTNVYLDITEDLSVYNIIWSAQTNFATGNNWWNGQYYYYLAGPLSTTALNSAINGTESPANYTTYFTGFSDDDGNNATKTQLLDGDSYGSTSTRASSATLVGSLADGISASDTPYYVIPGIYFKIEKWQRGSKSYSHSSNDAGNFALPKEIIGTGDSATLADDVTYPGFNLYVYNKTPLMNAINAAVAVSYNGAVNWGDWISAISAAKEVYNNREVVQSQIDAAVASLEGFVFDYSLTISKTPDASETDVVLKSVNGAALDTPSSVIGTSIEADGTTYVVEATSSSVDYTFLNWSDDEANTNPERTFTFNASSNVSAVFRYNEADYSEVNDALSSVPADLSIYTPESVKALQEAIARIIYDLPLSKQSEVDAFAQAINDALASLEVLPANYSNLDTAIQAAKDIPLDYIVNDDAKITFIEVLKNAENIDRNLDISGQGQIDLAEQQLLAALSGISILPADYTALDTAIATIPENPESYYSPESWTAYQTALANANSVDRTLNKLGQQIVDDATDKLVQAFNGLTVNGECYYGDLDKAIANVPSVDASNYTEDSYAAYISALAVAQSVERNMINDTEGVNQAVIDTAAQALVDAKNALVLKSADYTALDAEIADVPENPESYYSAESWALYSDALKTANSVTRTLTILDQSYIDSVTSELAKAKANLVPNGQCYYGDLDEAIAKAEAMNSEDYTAESNAALAEALAAAKAIERNMIDDNEGVNQAEIDNASKALNDAMKNAIELVTVTVTKNGTPVHVFKFNPGSVVGDTEILDYVQTLVGEDEVLMSVTYSDGSTVNSTDILNYDVTITAKTEPYVTYTELDAAVEAAKDALNGTGTLTEESKAALQEYLGKAAALTRPVGVSDPDNGQDIVDALTQSIIDATNNLAFDKSELLSAISNAESKDTTGYTSDSVNTLTEALSNANSVYNNPDATWNEIVSATETLNNALNGLAADKSGLQTAIDEANATDTTGYTPESITALEDAITAAEAVNSDPNATPADVQKAIDDLTAAKDGLTTDKSGLQTAIDEAKATDTTGYTPESVTALEDAITAAEAVNSDPDATPADVQKAIDDLTAAKDGLTTDKSGLQTAIDEAKAQDTTGYTPESVTDLENAITAAEGVLNNPDATPADVQKAIDDLTAAKDGLTTDKSGLQTAIDEAKATDTTGKSDETKKDLDDAIKAAEDVLNNSDATPEDVKNAIDDLTDAVNNLSDQITISVVDEGGNLISTVIVTVGSEMGDIASQITGVDGTVGNKTLVGYVDKDGNYISDTTAITGSMEIKPYYELTLIVPQADSQLTVDHTNKLMDGLTVGGNTVAEIKAQLENDSMQITVKDINGNVLNDTDLVGTGATITYTSKLTGEVYETVTVILYGDVDGNGTVDDTDFEKICNVANAREVITNAYLLMAADCDGDTAVDGYDAIYISLQSNGFCDINQQRIVVE
ncbi:MAG: hypothetical protein ACI4N4_06925 [Candidatus Fimenecus sp.]